MSEGKIKGNLSGRNCTAVVLGCPSHRKATAVLSTAQNAENGNQPIHSENRGLGNQNGECHWRDTRKELQTTLQDISPV